MSCIFAQGPLRMDEAKKCILAIGSQRYQVRLLLAEIKESYILKGGLQEVSLVHIMVKRNRF